MKALVMKIIAIIVVTLGLVILFDSVFIPMIKHAIGEAVGII